MANIVLNLDISKQPTMPAMIYGRVGDKGGLTADVTIFDVDMTTPLSLGNQVIRFEGITEDGNIVQDTTGVIKTGYDATKGEFGYKFPAETYGDVGKFMTAYFAIESANGSTRNTTGDFEIVVLDWSDTTRPKAEAALGNYNKLVQELKDLQAQNKKDLEDDMKQLQADLAKALNDFKNGSFYTKTETDTLISGLSTSLGAIAGQVALKANTADVYPKTQTYNKTEINDKFDAITLTKDAVGLGNVQNYGVATQAEAEAGTSNAKYMTPLRTEENFDKNFTERKATPDETALGTRDDVYITPLDLQSATQSVMPFVEYFDTGATTQNIANTEYNTCKIGPSMGISPNGNARRPYTVNSDGTLTMTRDCTAKISMTTKIVAGSTAPSGFHYWYATDVNNQPTLTGDDWEMTSIGSTLAASGTLNYNWVNHAERILELKQGQHIKITMRQASGTHSTRWAQVYSLTFTELLKDPTLQMDTSGLAQNPIVRYNDMEAYFNEKTKIATKNVDDTDIINGSANTMAGQLAGIFRRMGNEVYFFGRINIKAPQGLTPVLKVPDGFHVAQEYAKAVWNIPLAVSRTSTYVTNPPLSGGQVLGAGTQEVQFSGQLTGNWYIRANWFTDQPFPTALNGITVTHGGTQGMLAADPYLRESEIDQKLFDAQVKNGQQMVWGENHQITDPANPNFGAFNVSTNNSFQTMPAGAKYFSWDSTGNITVEMDGMYKVSAMVKVQYRTTGSLWHYVSMIVDPVSGAADASWDFAPFGGATQNRNRRYGQVTLRLHKGDKIHFKSDSSNTTTNQLQFINIDQFTLERLGD